MTPRIHEDQAQSDYENGDPYRSTTTPYNGKTLPWTDPAEYDDNEEADPGNIVSFRDLGATTKKTLSTPPKTPLLIAPKIITTLPTTTKGSTCQHEWRACIGKHGAYWWCRKCTCNKTHSIYIHNKNNQLIEDTSLLWYSTRKDTTDVKQQTLELTNVSLRSSR